MPEPIFITVALRHLNQEVYQAAQQIMAKQQGHLASHPRRQQEQVMAQYLRQTILADYLGCKPNADKPALVFARHPHGKLYVQGHQAVEFSQSHCLDLFALAVNQRGLPVGIDIESKQRDIRQEDLAQRILTAQEYLRFKHSTQPQKFLLKTWTIKEATVKACGLGIRLNFNELQTCPASSLEGVASHAAIGRFGYQCIDTPDHYCTVAWPQAEVNTPRSRSAPVVRLVSL